MKRQRLLLIAVLLFFVGLNSCQTRTKEEQFWEWFAANESSYYSDQGDHEALFEELSKQLATVDEGLTFDFSAVQPDGKKDFFISANGVVRTFPAVRKIVFAAPEFEHWRIQAFRQRSPDDFSTLTLDGHLVSYEDIYFRYTPGVPQIDIELHVRGYENIDSFKQAVYSALETLLGEYDAATRIKGLSIVALDESKRGKLAEFVELRTVIDDLKAKAPQVPEQ